MSSRMVFSVLLDYHYALIQLHSREKRRAEIAVAARPIRIESEAIEQPTLPQDLPSDGLHSSRQMDCRFFRSPASGNLALWKMYKHDMIDGSSSCSFLHAHAITDGVPGHMLKP